MIILFLIVLVYTDNSVPDSTVALETKTVQISTAKPPKIAV